MSRMHKGFEQSELDKILGTSAPDPTDGKAQFLAEADTTEIPATPPADATATAEKTVAIKTEQASRKMSGKLNKFKTELARRLPVSINKGLRENVPTWAMGEEDVAFMTESVESCFDVLDIEFQVKPLSMTVSNPLWVLLLPLLAAIVVFIPIGIKNAKLEREEHDAAPDPNTLAAPTE